MKRKVKTFKVGPKQLELGADGLYRFCLSVYEYPCMSEKFIANMAKVTGVQWKHLGTFMDVACFATAETLTGTFDVPYPI